MLLIALCVSAAQAQPAPVQDKTAEAHMKATSLKPGAAATVNLPLEKVNPVHIPRFDKPPVIDGKLDEEVWQHAAVFRDFVQVQPGDNIAPSEPSEALIGYDSKFLYLAFRAFDEPGKVRATVAKRDQIFDDDFIGVYLDTYNDRRKAFEFFFNPLGVQADAIRTEGNGEDFSVDFVHESKGVVGETGYFVEAAIPFKSLRYEPGKDKLWGLHIFRSIKRFNGELDSWMPLSRERTGTLNQEGHITGFEGISSGHVLEIIPSLTVSETGRRIPTVPPQLFAGVDSGRLLNEPIKNDIGVTAKFGITPTVTLDFAYNPDFAQVEADAPVVLANQRFPIFFDEKRPFFLEGKDIFITPITVVHTRTIIDPDYAAKLTGKVGRNTFGLLVASDNAPGNFSPEDRTNPLLLPSIARFIDRNSYIGVLRLKHDIGKENTLGFIATTYNFIGRHNNVGGFDGRFRLDPKTVVGFQALGTDTRRCAFGSTNTACFNRNAFAYSWSIDHGDRHFGYNFNGRGFTKYYRADVGFTQRTNTNASVFNLRYNSEPKPKAKLVSYRVRGFVAPSFDFQGRSQRVDVQPFLDLNLQHQSFITIGYRRAYERLIGEEFGGGFFGSQERHTYKTSFIFVAGSTPNKKYSVFAQIIRDLHVFDFDFGSGPKFPRVSPAALANPNNPLDPGAGNLWNIQTSFKYQPTDALVTSLDFTKQRLVRNDNNRVAFDDNIISSRTTYQFTRFTFARARIDYDSLFPRLSGQFLLGWTPNPGTAFYVGYNDDLRRVNPITGQLEQGFSRNRRTFFVKMSYLFRRTLGA